MLAAEQVELERMASSLAASAQACDAVPAPGSPNASAVPPRSCLFSERRAIASLRRSIDLELESRMRMVDEAQLKRQYACLWRHRALQLTPAVARIVTSSADASVYLDEDSASAAAAGPLDALTAALRATGKEDPRGTIEGSSVEARSRASRAARLLELCSALTAPALVAGGADALHRCLCAEVEEAREYAKQATTAAQARAEAAASATREAAQRALREAQARAAAHDAAREAAKERLFARLQAHPELARLVAEAASTSPAVAAASGGFHAQATGSGDPLEDSARTPSTF